MSPFQAILYMFFLLPMLVVKEALGKLSEFLENVDKKKLFERTIYFLIGILTFILIVLLLKGYRW
ncbi:MAG TPA: hypothetical protein PKZ36_03260 [Candidatus Paceibacterota bacterium]|nr:hypothetical protein [Candidatus Paceibacterota bacterium]